MEMVAILTCHVNLNLIFDWLIVCFCPVIKLDNRAGLYNKQNNTWLLCRYEITLLVFNLISYSFAALTREIRVEPQAPQARTLRKAKNTLVL